MVKTIIFPIHRSLGCIFHPPNPSIASQSFAQDTPSASKAAGSLMLSSRLRETYDRERPRERTRVSTTGSGG